MNERTLYETEKFGNIFKGEKYGIEKVAEKLKTIPGRQVLVSQVSNKSPTLFNGQTMAGTPSLFVFSTCQNLIREFETYRSEK